MIDCRVSVLALAAALLSCSQLAGQDLASDAPVWVPNRLPPLATSQRGAFPPHLGRTPLFASPYNVISDAELDQLRVQSPADPFEVHGLQGPVVIDTEFVDPVLALPANAQVWNWHVLPDDLIWHSYWAGTKESRMSGAVFEEFSNDVSLLDVTFGGRAAVLRYGTASYGRPEGWELQIEGASMLRLNLDENWDFEAADFRFGLPIIYGREEIQWKFSYYHLSSHLGDELIIRAGSTAGRINFSRDTLVLGFSYYPLPAWRWYAEAGWAFYADEGTDPWEFQFGLDYAQPGPTGACGTPFFALNGHLRQEVNYGGNLVAQAGWLWRSQRDRVLRTGLHYFNGKSNQYEFVNEFEQQLGVGIWYDY